MGLVLYLFRRNRRGQVLAFAVFYFLYGVVYMGLMASPDADFAWSQLFTRYYEIYGILAAPLMLCYNGQRAEATSGCSTPSIPPIFTSSTPCRGGSIFC